MKTCRHTLALASALFAVATLATPAAFAACHSCGRVVDLKAVKEEGHGSGLGAVIGGVAGGVLGHQIGSGRGNTAATVAGAAGGAYAGNEVEKSRNAATHYEVVVEMENGRHRTFTYRNPTKYRMGDAVKVVDGRLRLR